mmetsp:Transcript_49144/g.117066  ORF Transcript_49144/g.117066 Transcript_49144/m.117066 type:complete len:222 (+) Transcript_49144:80-745(+)
MPTAAVLSASLAAHHAPGHVGAISYDPTSFLSTSFKGLKMPPVMPLPPPPAAAAAQWAQHAYTASTQAAAARAAASKAAEVASAQAAAAQAAATQAQVAQVSAQQAAAAQVAQSLGYNVAPVGVPTAAAYGDMPSAAPPYGLSTPNPAPPPGLGPGPAIMSSMGEAAALPAAVMPQFGACCTERRKRSKPRCGSQAFCEEAEAFLALEPLSEQLLVTGEYL